MSDRWIDEDAALVDLYQELGVRNILLVGNDPWLRDSLSFYFQIRGCLLVSAASGREAIAALAGDRFDLILCEEVLPDGDGFLLLKLHGSRQPGAIKVLVGQSPSHSAVDDSPGSGIHGVIAKPFSLEALERALKRCRTQIRAYGKEEMPVE